MIRRVAVVLALTSVLCIPIVAHADTVTLNDYASSGRFGDNAAGGGGPFLATTHGSLLGNISFLTFCIEYNEHFSYGGTYNFTLSDAATNGGVGGPHPDPVSDATKWLYYEALFGGYTGWYTAVTGTALGSGTPTNVGANIQEAIWWLEEERTAAEIGGTGSASYKIAQYALANNMWSSLYAQGNRVFAMNLTTLAGGNAQDQLAYELVPEPGTILLLGSGVMGLVGAMRRRQRRG
jgi:hypothetical protein